jgi:outer membrane protein OmpA-like peptidoglycan-associated protein
MNTKHCSFTAILLLLVFITGYSQDPKTCGEQALFTALNNHSIKDCETKEFEQLTITRKDKTKGSVKEDKTGEYLKIAYGYEGEFSTRPSAVQIYANYANALTKAGGEILYNNNQSGLYGKTQKSGATYWMKVYTDNSGWYWVETVKEAPLRQDVVMTAAEIDAAMRQDGKAAFYGIYFDTDKAVVKPESAPSLRAIAAYLKEHPAITVYVVGHTDNTGAAEHNKQLSAARANAVANELTTAYGIAKSRLNPQGIGSLSPVATNDTEEGRAKNRRVEIVLQ